MYTPRKCSSKRMDASGVPVFQLTQMHRHDGFAMQKRRKNMKKIYICFVLLLAFSVFLGMTIGGYLSFSGRYGISQIECVQRFQNELFLIDNDAVTTWGTSEEHSPGEQIVFHFRCPRRIGTVKVSNALYETVTTPKIGIMVAGDDLQWNQIDAQCVTVRDVCSFVFEPALENCQHFSLVYLNGEPGAWPITEVQFYD